jgi:hypothetical protein
MHDHRAGLRVDDRDRVLVAMSVDADHVVPLLCKHPDRARLLREVVSRPTQHDLGDPSMCRLGRPWQSWCYQLGEVLVDARPVNLLAERRVAAK